MSEKKSMHYFEFHWQKILGATKGWKDDEFGAYVKLLIEQFDNGFIPDDPDEIDRLITTRKKNWPRLVKKFTAPSDAGQLRNTFMIGIRNEAHERSAINAENGKKGAEIKKKKRSDRLANGEAVAKRSDKRGLSQPVTSNQEPEDTLEEGESVNTRPDLSGSNLYRQPIIPLTEDVLRVFIQHGGTKEMADSFFDRNEATSWFFKGSPITNFANLVPSFITNWKKNEQKGNASGKNDESVVDQLREARKKHSV